MNADAFLALVEKYPPPWDLEPGDEMSETRYETPLGEPIPLPWWDDGLNLASAAPALAAAAIRLLQIDAHIHALMDSATRGEKLAFGEGAGLRDGTSESDRHAMFAQLGDAARKATDALRDALPEALRP